MRHTDAYVWTQALTCGQLYAHTHACTHAHTYTHTHNYVDTHAHTTKTFVACF